MTISATVIWRVRASGSNTNGGGYDPGISGAATDYSQQNSAQLVVTDLVTNGTTSATSATGSFTSAMIGNAAWLSGTGITTGPYFITAVGSSTSITLDRSPGTGTGGRCAVGGAWADPRTNVNSASYIVGGNVVYIRASGSGSVASPDYTMSSYCSCPGGSTNGPPVIYAGENGRPVIAASGQGLVFYPVGGTTYVFQGLYCLASSSTNGGNGVIGTQIGYMDFKVFDCKIDQNGYDVVGIYGATSVLNSEIFSSVTNTGTAGSNAGIAFKNSTYGAFISWNNVHDCWGHGIVCSYMPSVNDNIVANNRGDGIQIVETSQSFSGSVIQNTIYGNHGNGIYISNQNSLYGYQIKGNIIQNHTTTGTYGIKTGSGTLTTNNQIRGHNIGSNWFYNNTSNALNLQIGGTLNGYALGDSVGVDAGFSSASTENFLPGPAAVGSLSVVFLNSLSGTSSPTSTMAVGGVQLPAGSTNPWAITSTIWSTG